MKIVLILIKMIHGYKKKNESKNSKSVNNINLLPSHLEIDYSILKGVFLSSPKLDELYFSFEFVEFERLCGQ